jgi:hypothetical protein
VEQRAIYSGKKLLQMLFVSGAYLEQWSIDSARRGWRTPTNYHARRILFPKKMTAPTNHHLTITLPNGKHVRGRVVYLQSKAERWRVQTAQVHILVSEWLDPHWYPALYATGTQSYSGQFMPHAYEMPTAHDWLFKGTFEEQTEKG